MDLGGITGANNPDITIAGVETEAQNDEEAWFQDSSRRNQVSI